MKSFTALLLVCLLSFSHGFTVSFEGNATLANLDEFKFRSTSVTSISSGVYNGLFLSSVAVGANSAGSTSDILYAVATTSVLDAPSTYVSYFNSNVSADPNNPFSLNFAASKAMIANTYLRIEEVTADGTVAQKQELNGLYTTGESNTKGDISFMTLKKLGLFANGEFDITIIFSNKVGKLNIAGNPVITPKSAETLLSISGWKYKDEANKLVLSIGVGSASGSISGTGSLSAGSGLEGVYMSLATQAMVDGKNADVQVSTFADLASTNFGNLALMAKVQAKYAGNASFKVVKVTFPAGAKSITYDPTIGAGANPPDTGSATKLGLLLVAVLALLF